MTSGGGFGGEGQADVLYVDVKARADERSLRQMEQDMEGAGDRAGKKGGGALSNAFGGLIGGLPGLAVAAAAAVGAALVSGATAAVNFAQQARQGVREIGAELGLTGQEAEALGEVAKRVFGNNWGGSLAEAQRAVANVRREVQGLTDKELQAVAEGSVAIADRFQEDQSKVAAAVQSLMKATGVGAQEAMDFITAGFQRGLNSSGDFLDTLNEYGPQFQRAKTTGGELFSLLETGAAKGALGTDKIADAFKEFGISLSDSSEGMVQGFADLGIKQSDLTKQIDSGAITQAQAFQLVMDKLKGVQSETKRMEIMSMIFKGAGEDLGALSGQIDLTKTKMSDLSGSTGQVKASFDTFGSVFQTAWRQVLVQLEPVGQLLLDLASDALPDVQRAIEQVGPVVSQVVRFLVQGFRQARDGVDEVRPVLILLGSLFESVFNLIRTYWQNVLKPTLEAIAPIVQVVFGTVSSLVQTAIGIVTGVLNAVSALLRGDASQAWEFLAGAVVGGLDKVERTLTEALPKLLKLGGQLGEKVLEGMQAGLDGLQAMLLGALANALDDLAKDAPALLRPLVQKLAGAAREGAARNTADAHDHAATSAGINVGGPGPVTVSGQDLATLIGLAGRNTGTPFGGRYFGNKVHNGEDVFAPNGADVRAGFTGLLTTRWSETTGRVLELIDAQGQKLLYGHLQGFKDSLKGLPEEIQALFRASGGAAIRVTQGQLIGSVGQTGSLAHKDLGGKNAHVHVMAYDRDGNILDPKKVKFVPIEETDEARQAVTQQPKTGTPGNAGTTPPPVTPTVPLPSPAELKEYAFTLKDWNLHQKEALALARELAKAEAAHNTVWAQQVEEKIRGYTKDSQARAGAVEFAKKVLSDQAAIQEAASKKEEETDLQRDQRLRREQEARARLEGQIRDAGEKRLNQIIKLGVTETNSLEKITLAEKELERRGQLSAQARAQVKAEREKAADEEAAKDKARGEAQAAARARIAQELRAGNERGAAASLARIVLLNRDELASFKGTAQERLKLVRQQSQEEFDQAEKVARVKRNNALEVARLGSAQLRQSRIDAATTEYENTVLQLRSTRLSAVGTAIEGVTKAQADFTAELDAGTKAGNDALAALDNLALGGAELARQAGKLPDTARNFSDLQSRISELSDELGTPGVAEAWTASIEDAGRRGQITAEQVRLLLAQIQAGTQVLADAARAEQEAYASARAFNLETVGNRTDEGLLRLYDEAHAHRDIELMEAVAAEMGRRADDLNTRLNDSAKIASDDRIRLVQQENATVENAGVTYEFLASVHAELLALGRDPAQSGFITWLTQMAEGNDEAAEAAQRFLDKLERQAIVRDQLVQGPLNTASPARGTGTPGPIGLGDPAMSGPVDARGTRPIDQPMTESLARVPAEIGKAWADLQQQLVNTAWLEETAARLKGLDAAQLAAAKSAATARQDVAEMAAIRTEEGRRAQIAADSTRMIADAELELSTILTGETLPAFETRARALEAQAEQDAASRDRLLELAGAIREAGQAAQDNADRLNVTVKIGGIDTGIKQLDLYKMAIQGIADILTQTFSDLISGAETTAGGVVKSMAIMALGIVKQVAVAVLAYQVQLVALAILEGATLQWWKVAATIAAAAAIAGIAGGLQSRLQAQQGQSSAGSMSAGSSSAPASPPPAASNSNVVIPNSQVTVMAAPEGFAIFNRAAEKIDGAADKLVGVADLLTGEGVLVRAEVSATASRSLTAFDLSTP